MITSADCKKEIAKYFASVPKNINLRVERKNELSNENNWKRLSKVGNAKKGYARVFINKITGTIINVHSTDDKITEIKKSSEYVAAMDGEGGVFAVCRKTIETTDPFGYDFFYNLPWGIRPVVRFNDDGDVVGSKYAGNDVTEEEIDFENCEILEITDKYIKVCAGGDWQPPLTYYTTLKNGRLDWDKSKETTPDFREGLSFEEIKKIVDKGKK